MIISRWWDDGFLTSLYFSGESDSFVISRNYFSIGTPNGGVCNSIVGEKYHLKGDWSSGRSEGSSIPPPSVCLLGLSQTPHGDGFPTMFLAGGGEARNPQEDGVSHEKGWQRVIRIPPQITGTMYPLCGLLLVAPDLSWGLWPHQPLLLQLPPTKQIR